MFDLNETVNIPNMPSKNIFGRVKSEVSTLLDSLSQEDCKIVADSVEYKFRIYNEHFTGVINCLDNQLVIHLEFKRLLDLNEAKAQKKLDQWLQSLLSSSCDM